MSSSKSIREMSIELGRKQLEITGGWPHHSELIRDGDRYIMRYTPFTKEEWELWCEEYRAEKAERESERGKDSE